MTDTLFPKRVDLDNASIDELLALFNDTTKDLNGYLTTLQGDRISRSDIVRVRAQIQQRLATLGVTVGAWVSTTVPEQYAQGQVDAAKQQNHFGNVAAASLIASHIVSSSVKKDFEDKYGLGYIPGKVISPKQEFLDLHNQSVKAIADSMNKSFGATMTTISRTADRTVSKIQSLGIRAEIAKRASAGEETSTISKRVADVIKNNDISALVDSAGRNWTPENYADMLVKTKLTEARNNGMMDALTSVGQDLVEVSSHGATDLCSDWEGEILSISGDNDSYPSVADATDGGLFHPRCQHNLNSVDPSFYPNSMLDDLVSNL